MIREVFARCDQITNAVFRGYPDAPGSFFAQIDFAGPRGVSEGSKLSGTTILGVPCVTTAIDPVIAEQNPDKEGSMAAPDGIIGSEEIKQMQKDFAAKQKVELEDQQLRTVHIA